MVDQQPLVHDPSEQLGASRVDTDHAPWRHARTVYTDK
jgi:hypothetical protein